MFKIDRGRHVLCNTLITWKTLYRQTDLSVQIADYRSMFVTLETKFAYHKACIVQEFLRVIPRCTNFQVMYQVTSTARSHYRMLLELLPHSLSCMHTTPLRFYHRGPILNVNIIPRQSLLWESCEPKWIGNYPSQQSYSVMPSIFLLVCCGKLKPCACLPILCHCRLETAQLRHLNRPWARLFLTDLAIEL